MPCFQEDGYEIHRSVFDREEIAQLRKVADALADSFGSASVRHIRMRSEVLNRISADARLTRFLPDHLQPVRSILFDKTPEANWPVAWHQDLTICVEERREADGYGPWTEKDGAVHVHAPLALLSSMATVRIHLDDTPAANGALRVIPGSHRLGKIPSERLDDALQIQNKEVTCECAAGDVLVMSPLILHASRRAVSPCRRRILHFEYARLDDLDARLRWFEK